MSQNKLKILEKFHNEFEQLKFSDISRFILSSGMFNEFEFYQIGLKSNSEQMTKTLEILKDSIKSGQENKYWPNFFQGLIIEYPDLYEKIEVGFGKMKRNSNEAQTSSTQSPDSKVKRKNSKKIVKEDIGDPDISTFRHIMHIGWSETHGFSHQVFDTELMKAFFEKAGITEEQLEDQDTKNFIFQFLEIHQNELKKDLDVLQKKRESN